MRRKSFLENVLFTKSSKGCGMLCAFANRIFLNVSREGMNELIIDDRILRILNDKNLTFNA